MSALCAGCKAETLPVTIGREVVLVDPQPDDRGDLQVRRWRGGYDGRYSRTAGVLMPGWTRHRTHICPTPEEHQ